MQMRIHPSVFKVAVSAATLALLASLQLANAAPVSARGRGSMSRSLKTGATEQFKTAVYYDVSVERLSEEQQLLIKDVLVKGATEWLSNVLKVRPLKQRISFERTCVDKLYYYIRNDQRYCRGNCDPVVKCGPVDIPSDHLNGCRSCGRDGTTCVSSGGGEGVGDGHHFLLYVSAIDDKKCSSTRGILADSAHCLQEDDFDRPTAAYLNFCPHALSTDHTLSTLQLQLVLKELIHTMAFSEQLYPFYRNEQGYPRTERSASGIPVRHLDGTYSVDANTLRIVRNTQWTTLTPDVFHTVSLIVTPNVLREVRNHFNCTTMRGAELENQGGIFVSKNHWEQRIFGDELMTATPSTQPVVSRITLALLEDSGWYVPDYRYAGVLRWGHMAGCAFVNDSCAGWMKWAEQQRIETDPFCDGLDYRKGREGCVRGRSAVGPCFATNYTTDLPVEYQYLSRKRGGSLFLYDYCPVYSAVDYGTIRIGRSCLNPDHAPSVNESVSLEVYSSDSRCFDQMEPFVRTDEDESEVKGSTYGAGCYQYRCSAKRLFIKVGDQEYRCGGKGQKKSVALEQNGATYRGKLVCPAYEELCAAYDCINKCSDHGTCIEGVCYCHPGFYGDDCSQSHAQILLSCDDVTCQNEAKCNDSGDHAFQCECPPGYTGAFCEREIIEDPCIGETCSGNGFCSPSRGGKTPKCNCHDGWTGKSCQRVADLCEEAGTPCGDHGSCVANTTTCSCKPNRTGKQCELTIDFCEPENPCQNGGTCASDFDKQSFHCQCTSSYEGDFCDSLYLDPCTHEPCQNDANCTRVNSSAFTCECPEGWFGTICNQEDKCFVNPCQNGGSCVNIEHTYICLCPRGYMGERCRHLADPCEDNPCQHGGTCRPVMSAPRGTIECECAPNYYGQYCDSPRPMLLRPPL